MTLRKPFNQDIADEICERLIMGESLRSICKDSHIPDAVTISKWLANTPAFVTQYASAREAYADAEFEKIQEIADDGTNDYIERLNHNGAVPGWEVNGEAIARSRLRIDAIKWRVGKLRPKKYGEKLEVDQKTTLDVSDPVTALLTRIADTGNRLGRSTDVSSGEDSEHDEKPRNVPSGLAAKSSRA